MSLYQFEEALCHLLLQRPLSHTKYFSDNRSGRTTENLVTFEKFGKKIFFIIIRKIKIPVKKKVFSNIKIKASSQSAAFQI